MKIINRYQPVVVGITGSVGKTSTKEAIYTVLKDQFHVRKNDKNYNDQLGVPLTVIGVAPLESQKFSDRSKFIAGILRSFWTAFGWPKAQYPDVLVLELGADKPGDIRYLTDMVRPHVGVITAIGEVPAHVEYFQNPKAVAREKSVLVHSLPPGDGLAVLNYDDEVVLKMRENVTAKIRTFGSSQKADVHLSDVSYFMKEDSEDIGGLSFKVHNGGTFIPARVYNMVAPHQLSGVLAATAVGLYFGLNLVDISTKFENIDFPNGRMNLIPGANKTIILDGTYNSSPLSTHAALDVLRELGRAIAGTGQRRPRKVAILGDMLELGRYTEDAHRVIGAYAAKVASLVIAVGDSAVFVADSAEATLGRERVVHFRTIAEAESAVAQFIEPHDLILVKGSQSIRLEKVVKKLMAEPEKAKELLVRQSARWE